MCELCVCVCVCAKCVYLHSDDVAFFSGHCVVADVDKVK